MDLATKDERHIELDTRLFERCGVTLVNMANGRTQHARRIEHAFCVPDRDRVAVLVLLELLDLQDLAHRLRNAQVAGRQQHHEALARLLVNNHLAESADLVQPGIGTRVGQKNQPGIEFDGDTVGHGKR
jgi:hypothetical protein